MSNCVCECVSVRTRACGMCMCARACVYACAWGGGGDEPRFHKLQEAGPRSFFFVKTPGVRAENCGIFSCLYLRKYVNAECSAIVSECKGMRPPPGPSPMSRCVRAASRVPLPRRLGP